MATFRSSFIKYKPCIHPKHSQDFSKLSRDWGLSSWLPCVKWIGKSPKSLWQIQTRSSGRFTKNVNSWQNKPFSITVKTTNTQMQLHLGLSENILNIWLSLWTVTNMSSWYTVSELLTFCKNSFLRKHYMEPDGQNT